MQDEIYARYAAKLPIGKLVKYTEQYRFRGWTVKEGRTIPVLLPEGPIGRLAHLEPRNGMVPAAYICSLEACSTKPTIAILADNIEVVEEAQ